MKGFVLILLTLLLGLVTVDKALAEGPTEAQIALAACTGIPMDTLIQAEQRYDTWYGWEHHLVTAQDWESTYAGRVNDFAYQIGCIQIIYENDDGSQYLPFRFKILMPALQRWVYGD